MCKGRNPLLLSQRYLFLLLGHLVYYHPRLSSWTTICMCAAFCTFLPIATFKDSFRDGYFLTNSKSVEEHRAFMEFHNYTSMPYMMTLFGKCMDLRCSMLEQTYFKEMCEEIGRAKEAILPINNFYDRPIMLQKLLINSNDIHFTMLEKFVAEPESSMIVERYPYLLLGDKHISRQVVYGLQSGHPSALRYQMAFNGSNPANLTKLKQLEVRWYVKLENRMESKFYLFLLGDAVVDYEIQKAASKMYIHFAFGAVLMIGILYRIIWQYEQERAVNMVLTFFAVLCPTLAVLTTFGIFALCGIPINSAMLITPFLLLGVGVNGAFRLMHHWFYSLLVHLDRFCIMLMDIGPPITLAFASYVAAFLIGYLLSPSKDIALFCLCSAVAFAWCWVLQIFFFAPQLLLSAPLKIPQNNNDGYHVPIKYFTKYSSILGTFSCYHILVAVLMLLLYSICISSSLHMEENFAPERTFNSDSFLAKSLASLNTIYSDHHTVQILVTKIPENVTLLVADIARLESSETLCDNFTSWIGRYDEMYKPSATDIQGYFEYLPEFMKLYPDTVTNVIYSHNNTLVRISLDLCLKGFKTWRQRALEANHLRRILPEDYSMFFYDSHIFDLILSIRGTMLNAMRITMAVLVVICIFLLPSIKVAICSIISLLSTVTLVIGGLCFWGADLDVALMVNIIMAAGFTVDYISHVSYNLILELADILKRPEERMVTVLRSMTGPTFQVGMTTIVSVLPLLFHKVYMYALFAKTVVLCSIIGFLHAVFVMPFLISLIEMILPSHFVPREAIIHPGGSNAIPNEGVGIPLDIFRPVRPGEPASRSVPPYAPFPEEMSNPVDSFSVFGPFEPNAPDTGVGSGIVQDYSEFT